MRIWDTSTWELQNTFNGLSDGMSVDISQDGRWLAQGGSGIAIWDFQSLTRRHVLSEEKVWGAVAFSPDGRTLIVPGMDGKVVMWDVETGTALTSIDTGPDILIGCKVSSNGRKLGLTNWAANIWVWDVASMEEIDRHPTDNGRTLSRKALHRFSNEQFDSAEETLTTRA